MDMRKFLLIISVFFYSLCNAQTPLHKLIRKKAATVLMTATGGTITTDGDYKVHTFTSSGTFTVTYGSGNVQLLVVAGGGSGGGSFYDGGGGGAGALFAAESWDGGLNFSVKQVYGDLNYYRPAFLIQGVHPPGMAAFIGKLLGSFTIHREDWQAGATQRAIDSAMIEYAAFGTIRSDVLWLDTFNRADGALGTPLTGSALTVDTGTYTIVSNRAVSGSVGNNRMLATLAVPDYAYEITNTAAVGQWWVIFRGVDTANYWRVGANAAGSSALILQNIVSGTAASTYQDGISINQGDRIRVVCRGRRFRVFVNGRCWYESQDATGRHVTGVKIGAQCTNAGTSFDNMLVIA